MLNQLRALGICFKVLTLIIWAKVRGRHICQNYVGVLERAFHSPGRSPEGGNSLICLGNPINRGA